MPIGKINDTSASRTESQYVDLTHQLTPGMPTYPGAHELSPHLESVASIEKQGYAMSNIAVSLHVGTHIDAPAHMIAGGKKLNEYSVERFVGSVTVVNARGYELIDADLFADNRIKPGSILFVYTGHDRFFHTDSERYFKQHPVLTHAAANLLVEKQVGMVGFDLPGPDRWPFDLHKLLLANDILILENLTNLEQLLGVESIEVMALPLYCEADGAPARVVARVC